MPQRVEEHFERAMRGNADILVQQWLHCMLPRPTDTPSGEQRWDTKLVTKARPAIEEISCFADEASEYPYVDFVWKN